MSAAVIRLSMAFLTAVLLVLAGALLLSNYYLDEHYRLVVTGDDDGALQNVERASKLDPFSTEALIAEATMMQNQGRYQEAEKTLQKAVEREPANYETQEQLGNLRMNSMNRLSEAAVSYLEALELNPKDSSVRQGLATTYVSAGELEKAKTQYEKLQESGEISLDQMYDLGRIYVRTGEPEKGVRILRQTKNRAENGLQGLSGQQRQQQLAFIQSVELAMADGLVVQRRYSEAYQMVASSSSEQAPTIMSLINSNPEGYRQTVVDSDVY